MVALSTPAASISTTPSAAGAGACDDRPLPTSARIIQRITKRTGVHPYQAHASIATLDAVAPNEIATSPGAKRKLEEVFATAPVKKQKLVEQPKETQVEKPAVFAATIAQREAELARFLQQRAATRVRENAKHQAHQVAMAYRKKDEADMDATHAEDLAHLGEEVAEAKQRLMQRFLNDAMTDVARARDAEGKTPAALRVHVVGMSGATEPLPLESVEELEQDALPASATDDLQVPLPGFDEFMADSSDAFLVDDDTAYLASIDFLTDTGI